MRPGIQRFSTNPPFRVQLAFPESYVVSTDRYTDKKFRRCGPSGIDLPLISLCLWQNFGGSDVYETGRATLWRPFDRGITRFDLANNYGPPYGSAEENFGKVLFTDFAAHRDELIISTKAGWDMWPGPYGIGGIRCVAKGREGRIRSPLSTAAQNISRKPSVAEKNFDRRGAYPPGGNVPGASFAPLRKH